MDKKEWPEIITPKDLPKLTDGKIGRKLAYDIFGSPEFPKITIGNKWMCKTDDFWFWWDSKKRTIEDHQHTNPI